MANTENKQIPYESTQQDIRDEIGGVSGALKSTESTSRNVADILAEELARIAGHNASQVDYDNSTSQLSADDVQDAIDELASEKVDKEVGKGLSTNDYTTAEKTKLAGIEAGAEVNPTSSAKTATESFETVDGGLLSKCVIDLVPVQSGSGDPSPDNVRPISGHTEVDLKRDGANQWNETYFITGSKIKSYPIPVKENTEYRYINGSGYYASIDAVLSDGTYISFIGNIQNNTTFTTPLGCEYIAFTVTIDYGTTYKNDIAINYPSTITKYEPYLGHLYQVQIGSTVYGGTVDLVSGVMTVTQKSYQYSDAPVPTTKDNKNRWLFSHILSDALSDIKGKMWDATLNYDWYSSELAIKTEGLADVGESTCSFYGHNTNVEYRPRIADTYTAEQAQQIVRDNVIVYQINPYTIQLTPQQIETLAGQNNLSTPLSGQSIETNGVEYKELFTFADVKEYVDKKIPDAPTTDGTYTLQAVVSGGVPTYSWV